MSEPTESSPLLADSDAQPLNTSDSSSANRPSSTDRSRTASGEPRQQRKNQPDHEGPQSQTPQLPKADTDTSWPAPAGLHPPGPNDENLLIFRQALGISQPLPSSGDGGPALEEGRRAATGIYASVIHQQRSKRIQHAVVSVVLYTCHVAQVVLGAALTALGPSAARHARAITLLGAANTVVAGLLALAKGQGQPERLRKDEVGYRRLRDWIEETEALLAAGVVGRDRREVGLLVEVAFKKYNAVKASEVNNRPDNYVRQPEEGPEPEDGGGRLQSSGGESTGSTSSDGNAVVRLNMR
ncbi:hypothetical protein NKR23_g8547 [Pleurostoma richardsiae]|uniref:SMODS and SLOG-associating 2TM effector domain-containing protein n=1 Tax=Pleurostoma richardsiae TaxID=41990 RepID=A0AA38R957_9PEZI|nr:hypothetical protein NKR23_g8547 [Pleurostoma richardsiae]